MPSLICLKGFLWVSLGQVAPKYVRALPLNIWSIYIILSINRGDCLNPTVTGVDTHVCAYVRLLRQSYVSLNEHHLKQVFLAISSLITNLVDCYVVFPSLFAPCRFTS
jgi:hypothetical protein